MSENEEKKQSEEQATEQTEPQIAETEQDGKVDEPEGACGQTEGGKPEEKQPTELEKAQALAEDYKRKWYSVAAEYDNYRKRTATQTSQAYDAGKAEAILKLLPVADTFGYALDAAKDDATRAGIDKIIKNFNAILLSLGVEESPVKAGDAFNESLAEAVMNVPCEEGEQPGTIKLVLRKGFRQNGKVIRFAQVSVTV